MIATLRRAKDDDLPSIISLWLNNIDTSVTPWNITYVFRSYNRYFYVLERERIIGFVAGTVKSKGHGHISGIAVDKEYRGMGFGKKILRAAEDGFKQDGFEKVTLETRIGDAYARKFYESQGYKEIYVMKSYYHDGEDAVEYEKNL